MPRQILLADDSATIARMVQIAFAHEDYQVAVARGADDALARARSHRPDVVLVDHGLAGHSGRSGYDLCADLRAAGLRDVPVLILTSNFAPYDEARGQKAGADGSVNKPFETQGLIDRVGQVISAKSGGAVRPASNLGPAVSLPPAVAPRVQGPVSHPAVTVPAVSATPPSTQAVRPAAAAPTPAPVQHRAPTPPSPSPSVVTPVHAPAPTPAAHPPSAPRGPDSMSGIRVAPRATLMGLPTVGPDGLPIPIGTPPPMAPLRAPAPAHPPAPPTLVDLAPMGRTPTPSTPPVGTPQQMIAATSRPHTISAPPSETPTRPVLDAVRPTGHTPAPAAAPPPVAVAAHPVAVVAAPAPRLAPPVIPAIPANAPRMPRPSLVPNAPSPDALSSTERSAGFVSVFVPSQSMPSKPFSRARSVVGECSRRFQSS